MLNDLIDTLIQKREESLRSKISRYPRERFIASDIGECDRQMVYGITNWQDKQLHNEYVQALFNSGNNAERQVLQELMEDGFSVVQQQTPCEIKNRAGETICRGKIDGKIVFDGKQYPFEIKSMNANNFAQIKSLEDFEKKPHLRRYLNQMQIYLYVNNAEEGLFILTDLQGHYKYVPVYLDFGMAEWLLQRLERNWEHVKQKTLPEKIEYKENICGRCAFAHICLPDIINTGADFVDNEILEQRLERREELKEAVEEYKYIDDLIKDIFRFREIPDSIIGSKFRILAQKQTRRSIDTKSLPEEIKKQFEVEKEIVVVKILKL